MADSTLPVLLNRGLDLVTPPLMIETGSLIDCVNYEMTDTAGYRRIDGYERYDGYPTGAVYEFFRVNITAINPLDQDEIVPGVIISRIGDGLPKRDIGVVVGGEFPTNLFDVTPLTSTDSFVLEESLLLLQNLGFLVLQSELGLLALQGTPTGFGDEFIITTALGVQVPVTVNSVPVPGKTLGFTPMEYIEKLREYSAVLRDLVQLAPAPIAGLHWFEDRLLVAVNALGITVNVAPGVRPIEGVRMRWNGVIYRLVHVEVLSTGGSDQLRLSMYPIDVSPTVNDDLVEVTTADVNVTTWLANVTATGDPSLENEYTAVLGYYNNPNVSSMRGFTYMDAALKFSYDGGNYPGGLPPPLTLNTNNRDYWISGSGGTVLKVRLTGFNVESGVLTAGSGVGQAQVVVTEIISGTRDHIIDNDELHSAFPIVPATRVATVNVSAAGGAPVAMVNLAGTRALQAANTRYVWDTFNFYGQSAELNAYGATGASRGFWADKESYGHIYTNTDPLLDKPKYLAFHSAKLAYGFAKGTVLLSVTGEPWNFLGFDGALEIATGDDITGLLDLPGETLAVFGRRAVRKIVGTTDQDIRLGTLAANSSCFDYTACIVGADAVYTGVNGITTLQQSSAYGDFIGERLTNKISNWLRPKLVGTGSSFESGGVAMAYVIRSKSQYRLVLSTGEVVMVTFTGEGPKCTFQNYGLIGQLRIPFAWTSEIDDKGHEQSFVRWDVAELNQRTFQMENGWGFDGVTFRHYFVTSHVFNENGTMFAGIEKIRLYGQGYGFATLHVHSSSIEEDFDMTYENTEQDISIPRNPVILYNEMQPVTNIVDHANWGLGIKLRFEGTNPENSPDIEPSHICQVLVQHMRTEGALDS